MTFFQGNNLHLVNSSELKEDNLGEHCHVILRLYNIILVVNANQAAFIQA